MGGLDRYLDAQDGPGSGFDVALREIRAGGKRSHWIWYVFPQLAGLGTSGMSVRYAIADRAEARAYLRHPVLGKRLATITAAVAEQARRSRPLDVVMGSSIDATKLVSSLTLFARVARELHAAEPLDAWRDFADVADEVLAIAAREDRPPCRATLERLALDVT